MARKRNEKCVMKDCGNAAHSRGLCHRHYKAASTSIDKGETSWQELVSFGMAAPGKKPGRKSDFADVLKRRKAIAGT